MESNLVIQIELLLELKQKFKLYRIKGDIIFKLKMAQVKIESRNPGK